MSDIIRIPKGLILSLSKDEVRELRATPSWFDELSMRAAGARRASAGDLA